MALEEAGITPVPPASPVVLVLWLFLGKGITPQMLYNTYYYKTIHGLVTFSKFIIIIIIIIYYGERSKPLTNKSQGINMAKFKEVNVCPPWRLL